MKSGKLVSIDGEPKPRVNARPFPFAKQTKCQVFETAKFRTRRQRVKNAGCNEDIAVESAEF